MTKQFVNQKGFTLIEIISVLVILGIFAAVAIPKYMNLHSEAKKNAAMGQIAQIKGTLSAAWAKGCMAKSGSPELGDVFTNSALTSPGYIGIGQDNWGYTLTADGSDGYRIDVMNRDGDSEYAASGNWYLPK